MKFEETINELFTNSVEITSLPTFIVNMAMTALLSFLLSLIYVRFGQSLSNRKTLAKNFIMLAVTTTLIITIVKSSLALSLGLVGALSIVRFRAAIKEPEELTYLFLAIGIGLGMGANQPLVTIAAFVIISSIIVISKWVKTTPAQANLFVTISSKDTKNISVSQIMGLLTEIGAKASLKRSDERSDLFEASFLVDFKDVDSFEKFNQNVKTISNDIQVSCIDNYGITA